MRSRNLHQQLSRNLVTDRLLSHFDIFRMVRFYYTYNFNSPNIHQFQRLHSFETHSRLSCQGLRI